MKKWLSAWLCAVLVFLSAGSLAAVNYTLPEKMQKQLDIGSGLKGSITLHAEGNAPSILALQPFQDVELQFRGMRSGKEAHYYFYQAGEGETQHGLTEAYDSGTNIYFRSDLLPGEVFQIPELARTIDLLTRSEGGNPSIGSAIWRWLQMESADRDALIGPLEDRLSSQLEIWVAQFASVSEVRSMESGTSVLDLSYTIPMSEVRKEIVRLMVETIQSGEGQALLDQLLDEDQKAVFANANLDYFYEAALGAQENDYDLQYTRTVSTLGNPISSTLELPLDEQQMKFQTLIIEESNGMYSFTLRSEERLITLLIGSNIDFSQIDAMSAWIIVRPSSTGAEDAENPYHALRADIIRESSVTTDEESRDHERIHWNITLQRDVSRLPEGEDERLYPEETPVSLEVNLHYFSRYSQSSPTTLEIDAKLNKKDFSLSLQGQMKTASPWIFSPFDTTNAQDLFSLNKAQLTLKLAEFLASAGEQLTPVEDAIPSGEDDQTEANPTEAPAEETAEAEQTEVPAEETAEEEAPLSTEESPEEDASGEMEPANGEEALSDEAETAETGSQPASAETEAP